MYDNEQGCFVDGGWQTDPRYALWLVPIEPTDHRLYIIPAECVIAEIETNEDDGTLDALEALCRDHGLPTEEEYTALGLVDVPFVLWRFNAHDGYYTA